VRALPLGVAAELSVHYFGPSGVRALPLGVAAEQSVHYFGPSGVRALPLGVAAEQSVHYFVIIFLSSSPPHTLLPEGVVLGLVRKKIRFWVKKEFGTPH
jgi:hypothetical protein